MTFAIFNIDKSVVEYEVESWEELIKVADLSNCCSIIVKENIIRV